MAELATSLGELEGYFMACSDELKVLAEDVMNVNRERILAMADEGGAQ